MLTRIARQADTIHMTADAGIGSSQFVSLIGREWAVPPHRPAALRDHRIAAPTSAWASPKWRFAGDQKVTITPTLQCNTNEAAIIAARQGGGLTRVLHYQIGPALVAGELQVVLSGYEAPLPIHLLYPEGRSAPAKVRAFIDMAVPILRDSKLPN